MREELDPDVRWVAGLAGRSIEEATASIEEARADRELFRHIAKEHRSEGRRSYVEIDAPFELYALVRLLRPRHVVEVGVSSGVSSAYLLRALDRNRSGTLHSVDLPSRARAPPPGRSPSQFSWSLPPGRSPGWAVPFSLRGRWDLRLGDKADVLPLLAEELPDLGLFVYDVPHDCRRSRAEFQGMDALLPSGGVVIVDHGPDGDVCPALRRWAKARLGTARRRSGLGLFGFRAG